MRFFRRRMEFGWFALVALAGQLVLSFGHVHVGYEHEDLMARANWHEGHHERHGPNDHPPHLVPVASHQHEAPADSDDDDLACVACLAKTQAGFAVLHQPVLIGLSLAFLSTPPPVRSGAATTGEETIHFQARAPPQHWTV